MEQKRGAAILSLPLLAVLSPETRAFSLTPEKWGLLIVSSTLIIGIGTNLYYKGLRRVDVPTASFLEMTSPLVCVLMGCLFLNETLTPSQTAAMVVLLAAVYQIVRVSSLSKTSTKSPAPICEKQG